MSDQLQDIIARLEKASGPDHGIDGRIAMDVLGWTYEKRKPHDRKSYWRKPGDDWYLRQEYGPPRFTRSIDAALTLVPEGLNWACAPAWELREHRVYRPYKGEREWPEWMGEHKHDAIALCIAALRARASLSGKGEAS